MGLSERRKSEKAIAEGAMDDYIQARTHRDGHRLWRSKVGTIFGCGTSSKQTIKVL
jgi:hypothetical protein